ncbi:ROK family protein [bacterium]|nr:MAG: ROK family protein [bacterium]
MAVFAVDAGGTRIKLAVVSDGTILAKTSLDARSSEGLGPALPRIAEALRALGEYSVSGLAMAFPSLIEGDRVIGGVGKYQDAETLDLAAWTRDEFGVPFAIENDARMAAIGEWRFGAGQGVSDLAMVTLGTGIGTAVVSEGRVLRGRHGAAAILAGHMTGFVSGRPCPCGNVGCWETEASTSALPHLSETYRDYAAVFGSDDAEAVRIRERSLEVWSALAVSLVHAYDPEVLIFGGGVMASGEAILSPIREYVHLHAWTPWGSPRVMPAMLGNDAALVASEWLLQEVR